MFGPLFQVFPVKSIFFYLSSFTDDILSIFPVFGDTQCY
uniref:Uncharacterized protein n=1 Tax=Arundo donax TaxID=35708 RepID=A0A0A9BA57_ARUDO